MKRAFIFPLSWDSEYGAQHLKLCHLKKKGFPTITFSPQSIFHDSPSMTTREQATVLPWIKFQFSLVSADLYSSLTNMA